MGRKKKVVLVEEEPLEDLREKSDVLADAEDEKTLKKQLLTEEWLVDFQERFSDQPVKVLVEKYDDQGDWSMCRKYPLTGFDSEIVREEFGGGKYRASLYGPDGRYIQGGRSHFKFSELIRPLNAIKPPENPVVAMMIKTLESNQRTTMDLMTAMIGAQAQAQGKPSGSLTEVVEVMKGINSMAPKPEKAFDNLKETLGLFKLVKEVTSDGEGESKGGLLSDIKEFLEVYPAIKEQLAGLKPGVTPVAIPAPPIEERKPMVMDPLSAKIIALVPAFVGGAKANGPTKQWADYLLGELETNVMPVLLPVMREKYKPLVESEDDVYDILLKLAKDAGEREKIYQQIPPLSPHRDWLNRVIDEAIRLEDMPEAAEEPNGSEGPGGAVLAGVNGHAKP